MTPALLALLLFTVFTLVYFLVKYFMYGSAQMTIISGIYFLLVIISQYIISLLAIKEKCGNNDYVAAFSVTSLPWVFIFGMLYIVMSIFPSWKSPFANTFGYGATRLAGIRTLLVDNILKKDAYKQEGGYRKMAKRFIQRGGADENESSPISSIKEMTKALQHIYSDPSLLMNEITLENYDTFWTRMKPLFKSNANDYKDQLLKMVLLKDIISECIWYLLTGFLVTSMVSNSIANTQCKFSLKEMKRSQDASVKALNKAEEKKGEDTPKVYTTKE